MNIQNFNIGDLQCYRDLDGDGAIGMRNPKTIERYHEICKEQFDFDKHGLFFAFSNEQYEEERKRLVSKGFLKEDDELFSGPGGSIGTKEGFHAFAHFADEKDARIAKECDPQEVYIYEWENHECMYGDEWRAFAIVERIFGKERASKVKRF